MTTKEFQDLIVNSMSSYKFLGADDGYWLGANENICISDMDDGYRKNCINYLNKHRENIELGYFLEGVDKSEYNMADYDELVRHACEALERKIKELSQETLSEENSAIELIVRKVYFAYEDDRLSSIHLFSGPLGVKELVDLVVHQENLAPETAETVYKRVMNILDEIALDKNSFTGKKYRELYSVELQNRIIKASY